MNTCFQVFAECYTAVNTGVLIVRESARDKEFHFQNWVEERLRQTGLTFERRGRNAFPDFVLVDRAEGYEVKGLAHPGRELNYDSNSQVPCGRHMNREIYYIFGRYPQGEENTYEVIDLILCHGSFLNADNEYLHKNDHVKAFGSYGDIMIRDRKMYVAPTPLALTTGTQGHVTLIAPADLEPARWVLAVGELVRTEAAKLVVGYDFDLRSNKLTAHHIDNPNARREHRFIAYRMEQDHERQVTLKSPVAVEKERDLELESASDAE